ncbi:MAG: peptide chain release factor aRF-1 [Candidatus Altiarchaeota archaeon]
MAHMESKERHTLRKLIRELKEKQGRHTELISIYIPAGYDINNVISQLLQEQGTASNIKSKTTRKNVMDALERAIQHLRLFKQTPKNGLIVFCGNVSEREGVQEIRIWSLEPPEPIKIKIYQCDQNFLTQPLEDLITPKDVYGLIAIDNKTGTVALLKGDNYTIIKSATSYYHGKHRAGGQSHRRFERIIEEESHRFKEKIGNYANEAFLPLKDEIKGIIIGGPASTKDSFIEGPYLNHELKKKIIGVKDITYTDESGIRELIEKSKDLLKEVEMIRQKELMQNFLKKLVSGSNDVVYGNDIQKALEIGAVSHLLLSENLPDKEIEELFEKAKAIGAEVEILQDDFEEGFQLWNTFAGKAALLRFKI